ncbi:MAG: hypothetical protein ACXW25_04500 [Rhodospirillales bacterium]
MARSPAPATFRFGSPPRQGVAIDVAAVFFFVGVVIVGFGVAMLLPAFLDLIDDNLDYAVFLTSAGISIFAGLSLALACRRSRHSMGGREVTLAVSATWFSAVVVGSLPFMFPSSGCPSSTPCSRPCPGSPPPARRSSSASKAHRAGCCFGASS